jgi:galactose mutarotase-like enzyme
MIIIIWQKPGAPYICIEPWYGMADSEDATGNLAEKKGIMTLNAGEEFECFHTIEIN